MNNEKRKAGIWPLLLVLPALTLYSVFTILPALANVVFSFTDFNGNLFTAIHWVGLKNYRLAIFSSLGGDVLNAVKFTLIFALSVTVIQNIIALILAVLCNKKLLLRNFYRSIIFMPSILGTIVIGLAWTLILDPYTGPVNRLLNLIGTDSALLGDGTAARFLVIFVMIWANYGYAMVLYVSGLQGIPEELYESGRIDGTNSRTELRYITLPMLWPILTINVLISIIGSLKAYDLIMVLTFGGPNKATSTLGMYIFNSLFQGQSQGYVAAVSIIQFLIVLLFVVVTQYYLRRREVES